MLVRLEYYTDLVAFKLRRWPVVSTWNDIGGSGYRPVRHYCFLVRLITRGGVALSHYLPDVQAALYLPQRTPRHLALAWIGRP